ncbi:MAG TPA: dienelactone hydrolase [Desulfovibrio sp.]|nr:dienelactone hydrolase [Desulfovibrio sp.]
MHIILATEIWGHTPHVDTLAERLRSCASDVVVIDPYDGTDPDFGCEQDAYAAYCRQCGHEAFAARVEQALVRAGGDTVLVGFSAGATAVWSVLCAAECEARGGVGFYGSGIRTLLDRIPRAPVELVFPAYEEHFDVGTVVDSLAAQPDVRCHVVPQGHGFMNPLAAHFDPSAHEAWTAWLVRRMAAFTAS